MQTQLKVTWEHLEPSEFIERRIEREVAGLERRFGRITSCTVVVEGKSHRQHKGGLYGLRIRLVLPGGKELTATRNPDQDHAHEDAYVAVRDAFRALRRQLKEYAQARREQSQQSDALPHGIVSQLFTDEGYGFIRADDGREVYFHKNSVLTGFEHLRVGAEAHFSEEEGREGPQASSVRAYGVSDRSA